MKELETLCKNGVSPEEIEREKYQQATEYIRTLKTNNGIAGVIANTVLSYGSPVMADRYLNLLSSVDQDDIIRVSREYLHPDKLSIIRQFPSAEKAAEIVKAQTALESPKPEKSTLNSGATCISLPDNRLPLVDIGLIIPGGCMFENQDNCGISRLLASMLTAGTKSFSEEKFNQLIDDNAIDLGVTSGANSMLIKLNCPKDRLPVALDILKSMLTEPAFNKRELDREKNNLVQVLKSRAMTPQGAAEDKMFELLYGSHPYALPRSGKPESIAKITARSLRNYFNTRFVPASTFIGVAGDVTSSEAAEITQSIDSVLKWNTGKSDIFPEAPKFPEKDIFEEITLPREQAMVIFAVPGCDNLTEDRFAFDIAQNALNGLSSEIFKKVREEAGLAYSTGVMFTRGYHKGIVGFFAGTTRENAEEVAELLRSERDRLAKSGLTAKEFDAAREGALFACASQMERNDALLMNSLLSEFYGNGYMAPWKAAETFRNITRSRTNKILQRYFADTASVLVIAGPAAK
jgi:zinc protease